MIVTAVHSLSFEEFVLKYLEALEKTDLLALGFGVLGGVDFHREMGGGGQLSDLASLSRDLNCAVAAGADTDLYGARRKSVALCEKGRLTDVCDAVYPGDPGLAAGGDFRLYGFACGKIGVIVNRDLFCPVCARALASAEAKIFAAAADSPVSGRLILAARAAALQNGRPCLLTCRDYSLLSDMRGEIKFASPSPVFRWEFEIETSDEFLCERRLKNPYKT
jgi:predicted amidohydrolase